jgi:asparagine synthase (glutamine-hydrolysing)
VCGIAGFMQRSGTAEPATLEAQLRRLAHRGPDDTGHFTEGPVALGHARLSIIDPAGGHQPLFSPDGNLVVVANGEIYNFVELRETLTARGHRFATGSDSEVILHAYAAYGDAFLEHLEGMFAFALFDRDRDRLILARDRLGMKPLFLAPWAGGLAFASEIKGLLPAWPHTPEVEPDGLARYLQHQFSAGRRTPVAGIERVLPGEAVVVEAGAVRERFRYWTPWTVATRPESYEEAAERFDGLMDTVLRQHMRTDVPFGLFLSGGVDSSLLLALLSQYRDEPIRTFSVGFTSDRFRDELPIAEGLAARFGAHFTPLRLEPEQLLHRLPHTVWAADDLMRDYANLPTSLLAQAAGRELKVVFSGEGGDEAFAGYGRYRASTLERGLKGALHPGTGGFRTRGMLRGRQPHWLLQPALRTAVGRSREPFREAWAAAPGHWSDLQRMQGTDITTALPDNLLTKVDRMLMASGVEGRVPLVDRRLIEFGLSLPDGLKTGKGEGKVFLKRWAERHLPRDHLRARKQGFKVPVTEWLQGDFLDRLEHRLPRHPAVTPWFRPEGLRRLCRRQRRRGDAAQPLWAVLQFALWHRLLIEDGGRQAPPDQDPLELLE